MQEPETKPKVTTIDGVVLSKENGKTTIFCPANRDSFFLYDWKRKNQQAINQFKKV